MTNRVMRPLEWRLDLPTLGQDFSVKCWLEVVALSIGIPAIKMILQMDDPFFIHAPFPWILLPLLLIALRYGTVHAIAGFGLLLGSMLLHSWQLQQTYPDSKQLQMLAGMSIMILLAGELTGQWRRRYSEGQAHLDHLRNDMTKVERELQVLQVSHAQLEEEMLGVGHSLKRSLDLVKKNLPQEMSPTAQRAWLADKMMEVLGAYEWLETAAFLVVGSGGVKTAQILAQKGKVQALREGDFLLQEVMRSRRPVSFKREAYLDNVSDSVGSSLIAALPIMDGSGHLRMILAVQHIHFTAYNRKNLNLLATLCNWLGGLLPCQALMESRPNGTWISGAFAVADEIHTALSLLMQHKRSVVLVGASLPSTPEQAEYAKYFTGVAHGSNSLWQVPRGDRLMLVMLLPLSHPERFALYQQGVEKGFQQRFGQAIPQSGVKLTMQHIRQYQNKQQLVEYLRGVQ